MLQFEERIGSGLREDLQKEGITKLNEQARERQYKVLQRASSPPKTAEPIVPTQPNNRGTTSSSTMAMPWREEKKQTNKVKRNATKSG